MEPIELDARHVACLSLFMFAVIVLVITHSVAVLLIVAFLARALYLSSSKRSNARIILSPNVESRVGGKSYWKIGEVGNV
jgi:type IV secretory pathway VirB3-like protein